MLSISTIRMLLEQQDAVMLFNIPDRQLATLRTLASRQKRRGALSIISLDPKPATYYQRTVGGQWNATHDIIITAKEETTTMTNADIPVFEIWFDLYNGSTPMVVRIAAGIENARDCWDRLSREFFMLSSRP